MRLMNEIGYAVCHQLPSRGLSYGGRHMPVCARDTGFFLAFAAGFLVLLMVYRRQGRRYPGWPMVLALALLILPTVFDAVTSYTGLRSSNNAVRMITGALAGTGVAALVFPLASSCAFSGGPPRRILEKWGSFPLLLLVPATLSLAVWPDFPGAFWLWAPLTCLSLVFLLLVLNFTLVSLVTEWLEFRVRTWLVAAMAMGLALAEIVAANRLHWLFERIVS